MKINLLAGLVLMIGLASCASDLAPPSPNANSLLVTTQQEIELDMPLGGHMIFPTGVYKPVFQNDEGIYYLAPSYLVETIPWRTTIAGGIYIPFADTPDQRQAAWRNETGQTSLLMFGIQQPDSRYPLETNLVFQYIDGSKLYQQLPTTSSPYSTVTSPSTTVASAVTQDLPHAILASGTDPNKIYFYSPYDPQKRLLSVPKEDSRKQTICPYTGKLFIAP